MLLASSIKGAVDGVIVDLFEEYLRSKARISRRKDKDIRQVLKMVLKKV